MAPKQPASKKKSKTDNTPDKTESKKRKLMEKKMKIKS